MAVVGAAVLILVPVAMRSVVAASAMYNEGWNIQHLLRILSGEDLYDRDRLRVVNYTYLSFYLNAGLVRVFGQPLFVARCVSGVSFLAVLAGGYACVRALGGRRIGGVVAVALLAGTFCVTMGAWIGVADPQFLALALSVAALAVHLRARRVSTRVVLVPLLIVLSVFVKQQEIAMPAAIGCDMLVHRRRELPYWVLAGVGFAAVCFGVGLLAGDSFVARLLMPRRYNAYSGFTMVWQTVQTLQMLVAAGCVWLVAACPPGRRVVMGALGLAAFATMAVFGGGAGVSFNVVADFVFWAAVVAALGVTAPRLPAVVSAILIVFAGLQVELKAVLAEGRERAVWAGLQQEEVRFADDARYLSAREGDAFCEDMLLCAVAGKKLIIDPFNAQEAVATGVLDRAMELAPVVEGRFRTIQLSGAVVRDAGGVHLAGSGSTDRFDPALLEAIARFYVVDRVGVSRVFYVPAER